MIDAGTPTAAIIPLFIRFRLLPGKGSNKKPFMRERA
jgi:hypothetical protein